MLEIYAVIFSIFFLTAEVSNEEMSSLSNNDLRIKREDALTSFGRAALPSQESDGNTDEIIYGMVGGKWKKRKSPQKKGKKRYSRVREEEEESSAEEMQKDVADLREDIEALKSVLKNEEDKLDELEEAVDRKGGGRIWPYYYY